MSGMGWNSLVPHCSHKYFLETNHGNITSLLKESQLHSSVYDSIHLLVLASSWKTTFQSSNSSFSGTSRFFYLYRTLETFHFHPWTSLVLVRSLALISHYKQNIWGYKLDIKQKFPIIQKQHSMQAFPPTGNTPTSHLRRLLPSTPVIGNAINKKVFHWRLGPEFNQTPM